MTEIEQIQLHHLAFEIFVASGFGFYTTKAGGPRAEINYMVDLLNDNPSLIDQWKQRRILLLEADPQYVELIEQRVESLRVD